MKQSDAAGRREETEVQPVDEELTKRIGFFFCFLCFFVFIFKRFKQRPKHLSLGGTSMRLQDRRISCTGILQPLVSGQISEGFHMKSRTRLEGKL